MRNILAALFVCVIATPSFANTEAPSRAQVCRDQASEIMRQMQKAEQTIKKLEGIEDNVVYIGDFIGGDAGKAYIELGDQTFGSQRKNAEDYLVKAKSTISLLMECAVQ